MCCYVKLTSLYAFRCSIRCKTTIESNFVHGLTGKYHNHGTFVKRRAGAKAALANRPRGRPSQQDYLDAAKRFGINPLAISQVRSLAPPSTSTPDTASSSKLDLSSTTADPLYEASSFDCPENLHKSSIASSTNGKTPSDDEYDEDDDDPDDPFLLSQRMIQYLNPDISIKVKSEPLSDDDGLPVME